MSARTAELITNDPEQIPEDYLVDRLLQHGRIEQPPFCPSNYYAF